MDIRDAFFSSPRRSVKLDSYFPVYEELFERFKGKHITFVEIGVLGGGSLFMWRDFFGPEARIIGIDLNPKVKELEDHGFEIYLGDQADPKFWKSLEASIGKVDVILDDGGHRYDQQTVTVEEGLSLLKDDGMLVVEDIFTSYQNGYGPKSLSFLSYVRSRIDALQIRYEVNLQSSPRPEFRFW
jgi:predicted O-methyltransferase YrrM